MTGTITVNPTSMVWKSDLGPAHAHDKFTLTAPTGSIAGQDGQNGVADLHNATEPVGVLFPQTTFITFDVISGLPNLDINFIYPGIYSSAGCSAHPAHPGQVCTPPTVGGSPFSFVNNPPASHVTSSASWVFSGVTSDGLSTWYGIFTSQFPRSFQSALGALATGGSGSVTNSYSATITINPIVPEPSPVFTLASGVGLLLLSLTLKKIRRSRT